MYERIGQDRRRKREREIEKKERERDCYQVINIYKIEVLHIYIYIYIVVSFFLLFFSSAFVNSASHPSKIPVINQLTFLGQAFSRFVDLSLGYLVQVGSLQYNTNGMYMVTVQMGQFFNIISSLMDILYLF